MSIDWSSQSTQFVVNTLIKIRFSKIGKQHNTHTHTKQQHSISPSNFNQLQKPQTPHYTHNKHDVHFVNFKIDLGEYTHTHTFTPKYLEYLLQKKS